MAPTYKIALIQLHPKPLAVSDNFATACNLITRAAASGAHLAVLPEYHLTNWLPDSPKFIRACKESTKCVQKYQSLARFHRISIVPGTIVHPTFSLDSDTPILHNKTYYINSDGKILGSYTKKNLWHPERPHLTSSGHDPHTPIETPLGKIGLLICWDLAFPEAFRELVAQGAQMIIVPTFWTLSDCSPYGLALNPRAEELFLESVLQARAFENTCAVVFVNTGAEKGKGGQGTYAGLSRVTLPFVPPLGGDLVKSAEEGMSIVEVDMEIVEEAEKQYKVREDIGSEEWHYRKKRAENL